MSETFPCPSLTLLETFLALRAKSDQKYFSIQVLKFGRWSFNLGWLRGSSANHREPFAKFGNPSPLTWHFWKAFKINAMPIIMPNLCWRRHQFADSFRIDNIDIFWCEFKHLIKKHYIYRGMVPKKRFGVKYTRQSAPEHSSSDKGINTPICRPKLRKNYEKVSKGCP